MPERTCLNLDRFSASFRSGAVGLLLYILLSLTAAMAQAQSVTLKLVATDYPPYLYAEDGEAKGLEAEIIREVFERRLGVAVNFEFYPWRRAQQMIESGAADLFVAAATPERREFAEVGRVPLGYWSYSVVVNGTAAPAELFYQHDIKSLKAFRLIALGGSSWVEEYLPMLEFEWANSVEQMFKMLLHGRVDAIVGGSAVLRQYLVAHPAQQIVELPLAGPPVPLYLQFSEKSKHKALLGKAEAELVAL
ncbi:MAG: hypothetical protein CME36_16270 [unclassified Hahellaceae]|nr:hypothetical protein [Hahellaceae bacterium]|tara:strand:+ start:98106 stop:98852 length:747 start_codon:yes stop_codon:yes gene_type:complete